MKDLLVVLVMVVLGFSQINWEVEIVDSVPGAPYDFYFNSLALDTCRVAHIVYNKNEFEKVIYASRVDTGWQKETVDSGSSVFYGFSLIFDSDNIPHLSYYRGDDNTDKTYLCYARRGNADWQIEAVDSSTGSLGNYFWDFNSSIDLDTLGSPGVAYIAWNVDDSLHYIKYAHYNGTDWDTSVVEYDSAYANIQTAPTDFSPSLRFDSRNIPHIAFYHAYPLYDSDTLKIAYYDDSSSRWIVSPVLCNIGAGISISLALNSQDYPYIAHGVDIGLYCTWWDGVFWNQEYTGDDIGWLNIRIVIDLDNLDNPHIFYHPTGPVEYCYKDSVWHLCGRVDSTLDNLGDISLAIDNVDQPHVSFRFSDWDSIHQDNFAGLKYAKGTFVSVDEEEVTEIETGTFREIIFSGPLHLPEGKECRVFDIIGRVVTPDKIRPGVYFVEIDGEITKKVVKIR